MSRALIAIVKFTSRVFSSSSSSILTSIASIFKDVSSTLMVLFCDTTETRRTDAARDGGVTPLIDAHDERMRSGTTMTTCTSPSTSSPRRTTRVPRPRHRTVTAKANPDSMRWRTLSAHVARTHAWCARQESTRVWQTSPPRDVSRSALSSASSSSDDDEPTMNQTAGRTRLQIIVDNFRFGAGRRARRNLKKLPLALISLLVGFSVCALLPHPESPQDAFISFTIILLCEFSSSILYGRENQGGLLRWLKEGDFLPVLLNCFKIGVLYGLFVDAFKVGS